MPSFSYVELLCSCINSNSLNISESLVQILYLDLNRNKKEEKIAKWKKQQRSPLFFLSPSRPAPAQRAPHRAAQFSASPPSSSAFPLRPGQLGQRPPCQPMPRTPRPIPQPNSPACPSGRARSASAPSQPSTAACARLPSHIAHAFPAASRAPALCAARPARSQPRSAAARPRRACTPSIRH
jgi:hypothetical protein